MTARETDFVNDLYEAVLDPSGLQAFADLATDHLAASSAVLHEISGTEANAIVSSNIPGEVLDRYTSYYHYVNPLLPAAITRIPVGRPARLADLLPERAYFESEFFRDFARGVETDWVLGINVEFAPARQLAIAVHRTLREGDFSPEDCVRLERFAAPVKTALRLRERLGWMRRAGFDVLEALAFGAIVCDRSGRVAFANRAAEALAREGDGPVLGTRNGGGVSLTLPSEAAALQSAIEEAADSARGGAMGVTTPAGARMALLITPLPRRFGAASQLVLITMRPNDGTPLADAATLMALFRLTRAEAAVAVALSTGAGVAEIAAQSALSEETIRTHVKRCLGKAGAANQREFVAMLGRLPPIASTQPVS